MRKGLFSNIAATTVGVVAGASLVLAPAAALAEEHSCSGNKPAPAEAHKSCSGNKGCSGQAGASGAAGATGAEHHDAAAGDKKCSGEKKCSGNTGGGH